MFFFENKYVYVIIGLDGHTYEMCYIMLYCREKYFICVCVDVTILKSDWN